MSSADDIERQHREYLYDSFGGCGQIPEGPGSMPPDPSKFSPPLGMCFLDIPGFLEQ